MNIERLKELAGVNEFKGYTENTLENIYPNTLVFNIVF